MPIKQLVTLIRNIYIPNNSRYGDRAWAVKKEQLFTDSRSLQGREVVCAFTMIYRLALEMRYLLLFWTSSWCSHQFGGTRFNRSCVRFYTTKKAQPNRLRVQGYRKFPNSTFQIIGNKYIIKTVTPPRTYALSSCLSFYLKGLANFFL